VSSSPDNGNNNILREEIKVKNIKTEANLFSFIKLKVLCKSLAIYYWD
jgi:hypothetical protein